MAISPESGLLGLVLMLAVMFVMAVAISHTRWPKQVKLLLYVAVGLRVVGAVARSALAADSILYYRWGLRYAEYFSRFDFSPITDSAFWRNGALLGTNIVGYPAGFFIALIGPSWFGTFLGFALLGLVGVVAYAVAFRRAFPQASYLHYWAWLFLFPSIWFWPSSIGKEAIMMLGLGLATLGFVGKGRHENWTVMVAGLAVVFLIRPQVAAVFVFAVVLAHWLNFRDWSPGKLLQGTALVVVGLVGIWFAMVNTKAGGLDIESVEGYVEYNAGQLNQGGSAIGQVDVGPAGIPIAMMNVLFRPFLWEAHNVASLFSALELTFMWGMLWFRRREFRAMLKTWRSHRVLRFALVFVLFYVIALGMNVANLGLMARQRTLIFPLFFLLFEAGTMYAPQRRPGRPRRVAAPPRVVPPAAVPA